MSDMREMMAKKKELLKKGGAGASQKRVKPELIAETRGSQLSIYFDADDMHFLTRLKYKYPDVPRGKLLKYALKLMALDIEDKNPSTMDILGYKD